MYVTINFYVEPYLLKDIILLAPKLWSLRINKCEMCIIEKSKEIQSEKTLTWFLYNHYIICFAQYTVQCLKNVVQYLNMKMTDILVEIIESKFCSSLKWDGV